MNLNLSNFIEKPILDNLEKSHEEKEYKEKFKDYIDELAIYEKYMPSQENINQLNETSISILTTKVDNNNEEQKDSKHEKDIIQVRQLSLINRINKEKQQIKIQKLIVTQIDVSQNYIDYQFLKQNRPLLIDLFSNVILLDLSFNSLQDQGLQELQVWIQQGMPALQNLALRHNYLTYSCYSTALEILKQVKNLDLSQNELRDTFMQKILYELVDKEIVVNVESLTLKACGFTERAIPIIASCINKLPKIKQIDIKYNEIENESLLQELQQKLLIQLKKNQWNQMVPLPIPKEKQVDQSDTYFAEISEVQTLKYVIEKTNWIIDQRVLTLNQPRVQSIFPNSSKIIQKLLNLYHKSVNQVTSPSKDDKLNFAPVPISQELISAQIDLIQTFREKVMHANVCLLDLSFNNLADATLTRGLSLLKVCSHKLSVLKLDGNHMGFHGLQTLKNTIEKLGLNNISVLSLNDCGLKCKCNIDIFQKLDPQERQKQSLLNKCQIDMLVRILKLIKLQRLDLSFNSDLSMGFILHIKEDTDLKYLRSLNMQGTLTNLPDLRAFKQYIQIMPRIIQLSLLSNSSIYNPQSIQYIKQKINPIIIQNREQYLKEQGLKTMEQCLDLKYCIIDDQPVKSIEELMYHSDIKNNEIKMYQCINYETLEKFIILPKSVDTIQPEGTQHSHLYIKKIETGLIKLNEQIEMCNIYENFDFLLLDYFTKRIYCNLITKEDIAIQILEFYKKYNLRKNYFTSHHLVFQIDRQSRQHQIKLLPFRQAINYGVLRNELEKKEKDEDVDFVNKALDNFINEQCISRKVKIYKLHRYYQFIYSAQSVLMSKKNEEFINYQTELIRRLINGIRSNKSKYFHENMQLTIVFWMIIFDVYGIDFVIKKRHKKDSTAIERQIDKLMINFYIQLNQQLLSEDKRKKELEMDDEQFYSMVDIETDSNKADELYRKLSEIISIF